MLLATELDFSATQAIGSEFQDTSLNCEVNKHLYPIKRIKKWSQRKISFRGETGIKPSRSCSQRVY